MKLQFLTFFMKKSIFTPHQSRTLNSQITSSNFKREAKSHYPLKSTKSCIQNHKMHIFQFIDQYKLQEAFDRWIIKKNDCTQEKNRNKKIIQIDVKMLNLQFSSQFTRNWKFKHFNCKLVFVAIFSFVAIFFGVEIGMVWWL